MHDNKELALARLASIHYNTKKVTCTLEHVFAYLLQVMKMAHHCHWCSKQREWSNLLLDLLQYNK